MDHAQVPAIRRRYRTQMAARAHPRLSAVFAVLIACAVAPAAASASEPGTSGADAVSFNVDRYLGSDAEPVAGDLYRVPIAHAPDVFTHGPDMQLARTAGEVRAIGFGTGDPERAPVCATDYYQHVLYGRIAGATNDIETVREPIRTTMRRTNAVLNADSLASGGPTADYKVLCDGTGEIRVDTFTAPGSSFDSIVTAADNAGFGKSNVDYTIFFDAGGGNACGIGSYQDDERLVANNVSNNGGAYAVAYKGCWNDETAMHENGHNEGAVQYDAPYSTGNGAHCWDEEDVMCYSPDGGNLHQGGTISRCTDRIYYDCGYDTYFDSAPESGEYLATHWNIGSPLNRFITFGSGGSTNTPPTPNFNFSCSGRDCSFTDTSSDPDGSVASRAWTFGDGSSSIETNPAHSYASDGNYLVQLTVTDNEGATSSTTRTVTAGSGTDPGGVVQLFNGVGVNASSALSGGWRYYAIRVPRGERVLRVALRGPGCPGTDCDPDLDLYVRKGLKPTTAAAYCVPFLIGSYEDCVIRWPRRGVWYVGVNSYTATAPAGFSVRALYRR